MIEVLNDSFLMQYVNFPTFHYNIHDPGSILDLINTNAPNKRSQVCFKLHRTSTLSYLLGIRSEGDFSA